MNIGWPEGILLALMFISLTSNAVMHGKPRDAYSFPIAMVNFMICVLLLYLGGYFA